MGERRRGDDLVAESGEPERSALPLSLSRARALAAAALFAGGQIWSELTFGHIEIEAYWVVPMIISAGLLVAMVAGRAWGRALVLGCSAWLAVVYFLLWLGEHPAIHRGIDAGIDADRAAYHWFVGFAFVLYAAAAAVVAPWRRRELRRHGCALALIAFGCYGAFYQGLGTDAMADLAMLAAGLAAIGAARGARSASVLGIVAGIALGIAVTQWWTRSSHSAHEGYSLTRCLAPAACDAVRAAFVALFYASAIAIVLGAVVGRREARPVRRVLGDGAGLADVDLRRRWGVLFASAMTCLVAMSWIAGSFRALWDGGVPVMATCACAAIGVWCAAANVRRRWPAVVAVVLSLAVGLEACDRVRWLEFTGAAGVLLLIGTAAMIVSALVLAVRRPPAPPPLPIAKQI